MPNITLEQMQSVAMLLAGAALSDGDFHEKERDAIVEEMAQAYDLQPIPREISEVLSGFDPQSFDPDSSYSNLRSLEGDEKHTILKLVARVTIADGVVDIRENTFLLKAADALQADRKLLGQLLDEKLVTLRRP